MMKLLGFIRDPERGVMRFDLRKCKLETLPCHRIELLFCWYDFWVGWFWSEKVGALYVCLLPMLALKLTFGKLNTGVPR